MSRMQRKSAFRYCHGEERAPRAEAGARQSHVSDGVDNIREQIQRSELSGLVHRLAGCDMVIAFRKCYGALVLRRVSIWTNTVVVQFAQKLS